MIKLTEISKHELPEIIKISYKGDEDLLDKFHVERYTLEQAVNKEVELIDNMSTKLELKYFKVLNGENVIGYVVKSGNFLYSFAVSIYSRTKEILTQWWEALCLEMKESFHVGLMSNNTRTIRYLINRGFEKVWEEPEEKNIKEILFKN